MKIYKFIESVGLYCHPLNVSPTYIMGGGAGDFIFESSVIKYADYLQLAMHFNFYQILGKVYRRTLVNNKTNYIDETGEALDLPTQFLEAILWYCPSDRQSDFFIAKLENTPKRFKTSLAVFDCVDQSVIHQPIDSYNYSLLDNFVYGFDDDNKVLFKLNLQLEQVWVYKPELNFLSSKTPVKYKQTIISCLGPQQENRQLVKGIGHYSFSGGVK